MRRLILLSVLLLAIAAQSRSSWATPIRCTLAGEVLVYTSEDWCRDRQGIVTGAAVTFSPPAPADNSVEQERIPADRPTAIRTIQGRLNALGYAAGPVDGIAGPRTRRAIEDFQRAQGMAVDGVWSEALYRRLGTVWHQRR